MLKGKNYGEHIESNQVKNLSLFLKYLEWKYNKLQPVKITNMLQPKLFKIFETSQKVSRICFYLEQKIRFLQESMRDTNSKHCKTSEGWYDMID